MLSSSITLPPLPLSTCNTAEKKRDPRVVSSEQRRVVSSGGSSDIKRGRRILGSYRGVGDEKKHKDSGEYKKSEEVGISVMSFRAWVGGVRKRILRIIGLLIKKNFFFIFFKRKDLITRKN